MDATSQASLLRSFLLLIATLGYKLSSTTPAGKPEDKPPQENGDANSQGNGTRLVNRFGEGLADKDQVHDAPNSLLSRMAPSTKRMQIVMLSLSSMELLTHLLLLAYPSSSSVPDPAYILCPAKAYSKIIHAHQSPVPITEFFITFIIVIGVFIRRACFQALGKNFTFAHVTREKHTLVTWGPYAYARHASYTGVAMTHFGIVAMLWSDGGWMKECITMNAVHGLATTGNALLWSVRLLAGYFSAWNIIAVLALLLRAPREDLTLKAKFGKEWETYRDRVPWRFIPLLI